MRRLGLGGLGILAALVLTGCKEGPTPTGDLVCRMRLGVQTARTATQAWVLLQRQVRALACDDDLQVWTEIRNGQPEDHLLVFDQIALVLFAIVHPRGSHAWNWTRVQNLTKAEVLGRLPGSQSWPAGTIVAKS